MKLLLEELCLKDGVRIRLHTMVTDVQKNLDGRIETVITESKSGREAWLAGRMPRKLYASASSPLDGTFF